jgi:predicted HTH domain antitoxin
MPVVISDDILQHANLSEREALIEIACHLYDAQRIGKGLAARLAGLTRPEFDDELVRRGLPVIRYTDHLFD